jgi:hypothetical protein
MKGRRFVAGRGAIRLGFADVVIIAIVTALLVFAAWKQFPAYNRPFKPLRTRIPQTRKPIPRSLSTPAPQATSRR